MAENVLEKTIFRFGAPVGVGVMGGLATYFLQESVSQQIQQKPWLLPSLGALAATGATYMAIQSGIIKL